MPNTPSPNTWGLVGVGWTLGTAAAAGLEAPTTVWIVMAVAALACFAAAGRQYRSDAIGTDQVETGTPALPIPLEPGVFTLPPEPQRVIHSWEPTPGNEERKEKWKVLYDLAERAAWLGSRPVCSEGELQDWTDAYGKWLNGTLLQLEVEFTPADVELFRRPENGSYETLGEPYNEDHARMLRNLRLFENNLRRTMDQYAN